LSKKAVLGVLAAAIAVAYGGSTWWAGSQVKSRYDTAFDELPKQTALVRVVERNYERGFLGAVSTVTLEIGCARRRPAAATPHPPPPSPRKARTAEADEEDTEAEADSTPPSRCASPSATPSTTARWPADRSPRPPSTANWCSTPRPRPTSKKLFGEAKPLSAHTKVGFERRLHHRHDRRAQPRSPKTARASSPGKARKRAWT
jgi:hypothetical protein